MNPETPTEQIEKQEEKLGQKGSTIHLPISHNFTLFLIGLIILGTLAYLSYTFLNLGKNEPELSQNLAIQTDETTGWKTYRNEEYGFEIKYPQGWFTHNISKDVVQIQSSDPSDNLNGVGLPNTGNMWVIINNGCWLNSSYYENFSMPDISERTICQNNIQITGGVWLLDSEINKHKEILDQILSTFEFTNNYDTFDPDGTLSDISVNSVFKDWLKMNKVSWSVVESSDFSTSSTKFGYSYGSGCDTEYGMKLAVSPDKKRSMCFGSGGEPDSDLFLIDKNDNKSTRLAFCGTTCAYQSGFWLDNDKFVFLWAMYDYEYDNNMKPYRELHVDMYNLAENKVYSWTTKHLF